MKRITSQILITSPAGVESEIQKLQIYLADKISYLEAKYSFGAIERNDGKKDGENEPSKLPTVHIGSNQYVEIFPDGHVKCMSFFFEKSNQNRNGLNTAEVDLIGFANLTRIGYDCGSRVINDYIKYIGLAPADKSIVGSKIKAREVFKDFDFDNKTFADMRPYFVFSIQLKINYRVQNLC